MAEPPSYEESTSHRDRPNTDEKSNPKDSTAPGWSISEEVGTSRTQHVAAVVSQLLPQIRDRAKQGLSRSTLVLVPSDQNAFRRSQMVGFPEDDLPIAIQLEGRQNSSEFWLQDRAIAELQSQLLTAVSDGVPHELMQAPLPPREFPPSKKSWFGRKQSKIAELPRVTQVIEAPVKVDVQLEDLHFRTETEYGLFETLRSRCVLAKVEVR